MPTQNTTIDEGFEGCGSVRISYSPTATPRTPLLEDSEGRYLLVDRPEPTQALKIVLQYTPSTDPYDFFFGSTVGTITTTFYDVTTVQPSTTSAVGQGRYTRYEDVTSSSSDSDGGSSSSTNRLVYSERVGTDYDDDWNLIEVVYETFAFPMPLSSQSQGPHRSGSSTHSGHSLLTSDFRSINFETGAVSDGWAIVVYEVYEWGDSELSRFQFDSDPMPVTVRCLNSDCDEDCVPTYDSENNLLCICRDAEVNETYGYEYQPYEHNQTKPRYQEYQP
jgi:hypothetical protein